MADEAFREVLVYEMLTGLPLSYHEDSNGIADMTLTHPLSGEGIYYGLGDYNQPA